LFFPEEMLKQRIIQEIGTSTRVEVQIDQVSLYPLLTLDANRVSLEISGLPQTLEIEQLSVTPK
jgi:hypothetical protein